MFQSKSAESAQSERQTEATAPLPRPTVPSGTSRLASTEMRWIRRGQIFDPTAHDLDFDCTEFAVSPQVLLFDDFVRIYFSTRKKDPNTPGRNLSDIAFIDMDRDFKQIINHSRGPVVPLGGLGCYDEHGIFPLNVLRHDGKIWAYITGWSRRVSTSVELSTGLAFSHDNGLTFEKYGTGPVLTSSLREPVLVGDSFVQVYDGVFHMWYIFGRKWRESSEGAAPVRCYKIAHATSADGIHWEKEEAVEIISNVFGDEENQALPTVLKIGNRYHMYFCYRQSTDFHSNPQRGYRLGYAYSDDLKTWTRDDARGGMKFSETGWDSEMMCYPHIFEWHGKVYLLYNGNAFGKYGFGLAELVR